ncbi:purine and uridine phosphorylase [Lindgomyces ingoldianus]|uniref:Purine and uridine phosphorylase n=1 Tax=Lindgomyces ingoldianus TaxID=673940 RepID=A0ACB6QB23_9PLEO|nr:purine and uridine phosphorylase [Lindgomyces ingoldianus]KAF2463341.1 purine and uridine phosphorylase [Lindgomyces ingoldianus]
MTSTSISSSKINYSVGWICALPLELTAAMVMFDDRHLSLPQGLHDDNVYTLGSIGKHNVVIACLPAGQMGTNSAATVAGQMRLTFPAIGFWLMVGIGGGAPSRENDIRLGDVVVSRPGKSDGGVIQYDFGRTIAEGRFIRSGTLNAPPAALLNAVSALQARYNLWGHELAKYFSAFDSPLLKAKYTHQGGENDLLFEASYDHVGNAPTCDQCDRSRLVPRQRRPIDPVIHYGTIASGNQVMRHGASREQLRKESDILCFEMEAAGLMNNFPCIVVRGICDYADSHKNKRWQEYAAATATAYAKELLLITPSSTNPEAASSLS